ncbi:MAG: class I SAM-dependent methyltransferase [Patescibacteria group bacterium]
MNASVFSGSAAVAYAAFNLRDDYYREMAREVVAAARRANASSVPRAIDLGAGIGISTMEVIAATPGLRRMLAVEPEEGMRAFAELNVMGDPRVAVVAGRGEKLAEAVPADLRGQVDLLTCCQAFHLFNPPGKDSLVPALLAEAAQVMGAGGIFAFDLGPSNYAFALPLADHRAGSAKSGQIETELSHPLYQRVQAILLEEVRKDYPAFDRSDLWPAAGARQDFAGLEERFAAAGFTQFRCSEVLVPVPGRRVIEFIRNGWAVFFRWPPLVELDMEVKLGLMRRAIGRLLAEGELDRLSGLISYHPTAVFTAVRG